MAEPPAAVRLAIQPMLMLAAPAIYPAAWFVVALGMRRNWFPGSSRNRPSGDCRPGPDFSHSFGIVVLLAGSVFGGDWLKERRETSRALPPRWFP